MQIQIEKCKICGQEFESDSEKYYWHLKIHELENVPTQIMPNPPKNWDINKQYVQSDCMHDNCPGCKAGTCNGVHMMSCPCAKCSPRM